MHATPEALNEMLAELEEMGGEALVAFLEMQSEDVEGKGLPDVTPAFPEPDRGSDQTARIGRFKAPDPGAPDPGPKVSPGNDQSRPSSPACAEAAGVFRPQTNETARRARATCGAEDGPDEKHVQGGRRTKVWQVAPNKKSQLVELALP